MSTSTWSRLRWPFKALLIAAPVIVFSYFAITDGWFNAGDKSEIDHSITENKGGDANTQVDPSNSNTSKESDTKSSAKNSESRIFAYQPEKPVNGKLKGIVEVGATGFNSFIVNIDQQRRWEVISKDFGQSLVYEGLATTDDIRAGLKKYITMMFDKGVKSKDVHFIISSGAQKEPKTAIIASELKKMGFVVNLVTPEQEGKLALKGTLPESYNSSAFVTDIGSGNTKISWMNGSSVVAVEAPGSKYYEKDLSDNNVYNEVKSKATQIPKQNREVCFIIGGTPFDLAKQDRKGDERFTVLQAPGNYKGDKPKTKAGLNIYKAIQDATGCDTFVFDWDANFSIGFLLGLPF
jgi:hypothetical protein